MTTSQATRERRQARRAATAPCSRPRACASPADVARRRRNAGAHQALHDAAAHGAGADDADARCASRDRPRRSVISGRTNGWQSLSGVASRRLHELAGPCPCRATPIVAVGEARRRIGSRESDRAPRDCRPASAAGASPASKRITTALAGATCTRTCSSRPLFLLAGQHQRTLTMSSATSAAAHSRQRRRERRAHVAHASIQHGHAAHVASRTRPIVATLRAGKRTASRIGRAPRLAGPCAKLSPVRLPPARHRAGPRDSAQKHPRVRGSVSRNVVELLGEHVARPDADTRRRPTSRPSPAAAAGSSRNLQSVRYSISS